jgi:hypothetical protein
MDIMNRKISKTVKRFLDLLIDMGMLVALTIVIFIIIFALAQVVVTFQSIKKASEIYIELNEKKLLID